MNRSIRFPLTLAIAAASAAPAFAVIDVTSATTGIADAGTAILAVVAAMTLVAVSVWGVKKVLRMFGG